MTLDRTSRLPASARQRVAVLVLLALGFLWLMTPRLHGPVTAHLHKEDGTVFLTDLLRGLPLTETYTGYLHVAPRAAAQVCAALPSEAFAPCVSGASAAVRIALAALVLMVLLPYLRSFGWALAAAALPVLGGVGQQEVLGNITNLRWFLDVAVVFCLLGVFRYAGPICFAGILALLGATSDPLALVAAPLALWRFLSTPGRARIVPCLYALGVVVHAAFLTPSSRPVEVEGILAEPLLFGQNLLVRSVTEAVLGETGGQAALSVLGGAAVTLLTLVLAVLFFVAGRRSLNRELRLLSALLLGSGLLVTFGTLCFTDPGSVDVTGGLARASRYALAPSLLIGSSILVLLSGVGRQGIWRVVTIGLCSLMAVSAVVDSRGDEWATRGPEWATTVEAARNDCADGRRRVTVPVTPQGVPTSWTAELDCSWLER